MIYPKFTKLKQMLMDDLDLNEETFIQPTSMQDYYNQGVAFIESYVHTIYEDYFKSRVSRNVTADQDSILLPDNIYANKIRHIFWNGADKEDRYEIKRIREQINVLWVDPNDRYRYDLVNEGETEENPIGTTALVYPPFRDTTNYSTNKPLLIYYLRSANRYVDDDSVCDIPEFSDALNQYVAYRCRKKEGHPLTDTEKADLQIWVDVMVSTLKSRTPDNNDEILKDLSFYQDFDPFSSIY